MKIQKLLLATMLCSVFGIFAACSESDIIENEIPDITPEVGEIETVLALSTGLGDGFVSTKAGGPINTDDKGNLKYDLTLNTASNLVIALFNVDKNGKPTTLIDIKSVDDPVIGNDGSYAIPPFKFKITPSITVTEDNSSKSYGKVAVVALGNTKSTDLDITQLTDNTFEGFKEFTKNLSVNPGCFYINWDGSLPSSGGVSVNKYPLSSNVYVFKIEAGAVNGVGVNKEAALASVKSAFDTDAVDYNEVTSSTINLYRTNAEVELTGLTFDDYSDDMKFDHFVLEEVFVMNVPQTVNWFNSELPTGDAVCSNLDWGGNLNLPYSSYDFSKGVKYFFAGNGWKDDKAGDYLIKGESGKYCNKYILASTKKKQLGFSFANYGENIRGEEYREYTDPLWKSYCGAFYIKDQPYDMRQQCTPDQAGTSKWPQIKFAVSPSNYAKDGTDKALCLVVRGRYYYKTNNGTVVGSNVSLEKDPYASKYYTVVVNREGDTYAGTQPDHTNEVRRNVRYQISLTISGPGSETPWDYTENSYVVPKVKIVPFGLVEQDSKLD